MFAKKTMTYNGIQILGYWCQHNYINCKQTMKLLTHIWHILLAVFIVNTFTSYKQKRNDLALYKQYIFLSLLYKFKRHIIYHTIYTVYVTFKKYNSEKRYKYIGNWNSLRIRLFLYGMVLQKNIHSKFLYCNSFDYTTCFLKKYQISILLYHNFIIISLKDSCT